MNVMWWRKDKAAASRADAAVSKAHRELAHTRDRWAAINDVAARSQEQARMNHFGETIANALGDHR